MSKQTKLTTTELLFNAAHKLGLEPVWMQPRGLFAITAHGRELYINFSNSPINTHTSVSLARNKHLTRLILRRHNLPNIPFLLPNNYDEAAAFLAVHGKIIAKPVTGSGSRDIHIIDRNEQFPPSAINNYILEKYITGTEMRYLVLNGSVIAVHQSEYGESVEQNRYLERYSLSENDWDSELVAESIRTIDIMGLGFGAIDYLIDAAGTHHILEINSAPGLKWFHAPTRGPAVDVATMFVQSLLLRQPLVQQGTYTTDTASTWYTQLA